MVNTSDKASKQAESDKIGHYELQKFWKMTVADFDKRKAKKSESVSEEPKERFLQSDYEWRGSLNDHNSHGNKVKKEVESANTEPGESGVKVETDDAFFKRERKDVIDVTTDDQHYNTCALGKAKIPETPVGKTVRPKRKLVNTKMYIDLSGYIEEESIYHGFHYYISVVTAEGYSYLGLVSEIAVVDGTGKDFE